MESPTIAAIVPCYNEETTIATVVEELQQYVPEITVYVYDNNSQDRTAAVARAAGAIVRREERPGKGNVMRRAFADIDADVYVMVDGDDTYGIAALPEMIHTLLSGPYDHVLGCRQDDPQNSAYRPGHGLGNRVFASLVSSLFGTDGVTDLFSGYRVMSKRFVKSFPSLSRGFEIETELTVHCLEVRTPNREIPCGFKDRPAGSESKLNTIKDGVKILSFIGRLFHAQHPAIFYGLISGITLILGLILGIPVVWEFAQTGYVPRLPTAVLASSLVIIAVLAAMLGIILSGILRARLETIRLNYLQHSSLYLPNYDPQTGGAGETKSTKRTKSAEEQKGMKNTENRKNTTKGTKGTDSESQ